MDGYLILLKAAGLRLGNLKFHREKMKRDWISCSLDVHAEISLLRVKF